MNSDGWGFTGAGFDDLRLAGMDLQHNTQTRTMGKIKGPARIITHGPESGGPMKEHMEHEHHGHSPLEEEKHRHEEAMDHHKHHLERHHGRNFDSQHGHDHYKY